MSVIENPLFDQNDVIFGLPFVLEEKMNSHLH